MRVVAITAGLASAITAIGAGCVLPPYTWVPSEGGSADASVAAPTDARGPGALRGSVSYPTSSGVPQPAILRVWLTTNEDGDAGVDTACPTTMIWPPTYEQTIDPAPNPGSYGFDNIPTGRYCLTVVLDFAPFLAPGEPPGCADARMGPRNVMVTAPVTTVPPVVLVGGGCR